MEPRPDLLRNQRRGSPSVGVVGWTAVLGLALISVCLGASTAQAQEAEPQGGETSVEPVDEVGVTDAQPAFGNVDASKVPNEEKKTRVETMIQEQRATLARVTELLAEARATKDIVQLNCVNEKLTQVKGLLKISEQASLQMYEALASTAQDLVNHEYTKVVVAHQKSQVLRAEAEQCVGAASVYAGDTLVDVEIEGDGGFGADPTSASAPPPGPAVPPVASSF